MAVRFYTCTDIDRTPGTSGSIFPFGVSQTEGFYDVDKLTSGVNSYKSTWINDDVMCWACAYAGILQWWLDDYKIKTGQDWEMRHPDAFPEKSLCYSTPLMDVFMDACNNLPGAAQDVLWFMSGKDTNTIVNDEQWQFKESYKYWKGGFMGMTEKEAKSYFNIKP